ncbi:MAG TPA: hypothetical protein VGX68_23405 [Thermoanaerobaculia bacterium]|jgi:hypothetical protein|nr:hypothetical protein [Thermoanaerobaculia bacterium]
MVRPLIAKFGLLALMLAPVQAAANSVAATQVAALGTGSSQWGLQVNLVDVSPRNATYVVAGPDKGFNNETTLNGSFFIDPQNVTMSTAAGANSFQMIAFNDGVGAGTKTRMIFHLNHATADGWFINVWHWNDNAGGFVFSGGAFFACASASCGVVANWHNNRIDFQWNAGNPGHLTLWRTRYINGAPDATGTVQMFSVNMPGMQSAVINYAFAGMFASHDPGTSGTLFLDEFVFNR